MAVDYDAWLTSSRAYEEYIGASYDNDDEEVEEYDYCDAHEDEWKAEGTWLK